MAWYRYVNALSLDVVLGAIISSLFIANLLEVNLPYTILTTLGLAIWTIYTIDHLWDAYQSKNLNLAFRHQLHKNNFTVFSVLVVSSIVIGGIIIWYIPTATRVWGLGLTIGVMVYFTLIQFLKKQNYYKEILVALVYTGGVLIGPFSLYKGALNIPHILVIIQFLALAFSNLLVFAYFETETDHYQNVGSLARSIGKPRTQSLIVGLLIMVMLTAVVCIVIYSRQGLIRNSQWIMLLMTVFLIATIKWPGFFKKDDRYRYLGDGIFFLPVLIL